jgi:dihydrofolate reductase
LAGIPLAYVSLDGLAVGASRDAGEAAESMEEITMRKVVSGLFISLDGVVESPDQWQFDNFDDDMAALMGEMLAVQDAVLLGRVTYQEWAPYWPTSKDEPFASYINNTPKYVVSTTLDRVDWQNSTLIKGNLADALADLKRQPGKNIGVAGSPTLVRSLLEGDLLDELLLMVHPVIVGSGKRLFADGAGLKRLKLVASTTTRTGVAVLTYQPAG